MTTTQDFSFGAYVVEAAFLGDTAAFALGDGTVRLIDGGHEKTVAVHAGAILAATVTRDGKLITGGDDGRMARSDAAGNVETLAERPRKWIDLVAAGPNGAIAYASGRQAVVRFADGRERTLDHDRAVGGIAFAPKGLRLAVAGYDGVTLWWVRTEAAPATLDRKGAHQAVTFSPDGRYLVTAMQENALHCWRLADGKDMSMSGYPAKPKALSWSAKGRYLATSGASAAVLWPFHFKDGPMGKEPLQRGAREAAVTRLACHPRTPTVAVGYYDGAVRGVSIVNAREAPVTEPGRGPVSAIAWHPSGRWLAFGTEEGTAGVVEFAGSADHGDDGQDDNQS